MDKRNQIQPIQSEGEFNLSAKRSRWHLDALDQDTQKQVDDDARLFVHQSLSSPCLTAVEKAEGPYIWDSQGRRYLDFHGNNVHHIGYGHPRLKQAITRQMDALPFAPRRFTCKPATALAQKLADIAPGNLSKVLFTTGGSDAVEVALKIARAATGRFKTISFWDAFHGAGFGASSVGGEQLFRSHIVGPLLAGSEHVAPFYCYRCPYGHKDIVGQPDLKKCGLACAAMVRYVLQKEGDVAAVVAEPMRATPVLPPPGFWKSVRQACDDYGALLIFDEIPTGLGKTGRMFACDHDGVVPDICVLGKSLGGGILPIAAVIATPDLDVAGKFALGHYTHEKNPVTTRAALTTIQIIEDQRLVENAAAVGAYAMKRLNLLQKRYPVIGDVRGKGMLLGVELVKDRDVKTPATDLAEALHYACLRKGLSFKISMGNIISLTPPLVLTQSEMEHALDVLEQSLSQVLQDPTGDDKTIKEE